MVGFKSFSIKGIVVVILGVAVCACRAGTGQAPAGATNVGAPSQSLPEALQSAAQAKPVKVTYVDVCKLKNAGASMMATAGVWAVANPGARPANEKPKVVDVVLCDLQAPVAPVIDWYARFLNGPQVKAMTPLEKAHLAARNLIDPFNLLTIGGEAAISVAANSHSPYGPGMPGYGRYVGVSFTQDMTGEFFGTFLIPSIARQDPHYHRMPGASIPRRALHTITQVAWTQGDNGRGMVNYADLVGFACDDAVGSLYVPGVQTTFGAGAERYGIALATAPIDNVITEFVPDLARRIHVQVVVIQRIVNRFATTSSSSNRGFGVAFQEQGLGAGTREQGTEGRGGGGGCKRLRARSSIKCLVIQRRAAWLWTAIDVVAAEPFVQSEFGLEGCERGIGLRHGIALDLQLALDDSQRMLRERARSTIWAGEYGSVAGSKSSTGNLRDAAGGKVKRIFAWEQDQAVIEGNVGRGIAQQFVKFGKVWPWRRQTCKRGEGGMQDRAIG